MTARCVRGALLLLAIVFLGDFACGKTSFGGEQLQPQNGAVRTEPHRTAPNGESVRSESSQSNGTVPNGEESSSEKSRTELPPFLQPEKTVRRRIPVVVSPEDASRMYFWNPDLRSNGAVTELPLADGAVDADEAQKEAEWDSKWKEIEARRVREEARELGVGCGCHCGCGCDACSRSSSLLEAAGTASPAPAAPSSPAKAADEPAKKEAWKKASAVLEKKVRMMLNSLDAKYNVTAPVHFPGDGGVPVVCHTPVELRRYLDLTGVDHDDDSGVQLVATPFAYEDNQRQTASGHVAPDGFQYFFMHDRPNNMLMGRECFSADMEYENSLQETHANSREVVHGCTPFRVLGKQLQRAVSCAVAALGQEAWDLAEPVLMRLLSLEAMRQDPVLFPMVSSDAFSMFFANWTSGRLHVRPTPEQIVVAQSCFADQQRPLMCLPALGGSVTMLNGNGVREISSRWIELRHHTVLDCHVPSGCSRLAAAALLHFNMKQLDEDQGVVAEPSWMADCRLRGREKENWFEDPGAGTANCRVHAACHELALRQVCRSAPECCPSLPVFLACNKDATSPECADVCRIGRTKPLGKSPLSDVGKELDKVEQQFDKFLAGQEAGNGRTGGSGTSGGPSDGSPRIDGDRVVVDAIDVTRAGSGLGDNRVAAEDVTAARAGQNEDGSGDNGEQEAVDKNQLSWSDALLSESYPG